MAIITKNEAHNLPRLLDSLQALNPAEILVLDSGSQDDTVSIATAAGATVIQTDWPGYVIQKNRALEACREGWVLSLDADEPISAQLASNLRILFEGDGPDKDGYELNRLTWYLGDWVRHVWYPEWRLRLVRADRAQWVGHEVHEQLDVHGTIGRLAGDIHHYSHRDIEDHFRRSIDYARISAESLAARGKKFRWHKLVLSPLVRFLRLMILRQGWRDGWRGWIVAWSSMFSGFLKYAFLYEIERRRAQTVREEPRP